MMKIIKSKIHFNWYLWFFLILFCEIGIIISLIKVIIRKIDDYNNLSFIPIFILLIIILSFLLVLKDFKYIKIDKEKNRLKYYSILSPFGRTLNLENYENKIITSEVSIQGSYDVIHLVNKKGYTAFKISGLFYENFKEINSSIKLQRIYSYRFNWKLYLKLLFTGRIKIEKKCFF